MKVSAVSMTTPKTISNIPSITNQIMVYCPWW